MNPCEYQDEVKRTMKPGLNTSLSDREVMIAWKAIGLSGEAGEVSNLVKRGIFHEHGLDIQKLTEELGDCLWYIYALCTLIDADISDVMQQNIEKLKKRYPCGFSPEASFSRYLTKDD